MLETDGEQIIIIINILSSLWARNGFMKRFDVQLPFMFAITLRNIYAAYVHTYDHTHTHTHMYAHTHTRTHTHTHTHAYI